MQPILGLGNSLNWNRLVTQNFVAQQIATTPDLFVPIPSASYLTDANILQVGCGSVSAKPNWRLGCWLGISLNIPPSSTSSFFQWTEYQRIPIYLGALKLIQFPMYEPVPYRLTLYFPKWIKDLFVEIWVYDGIQSNSVEARLKNVEMEVINISGKIDDLGNQT